jgi:ribosomal protein S18 acetylase RimI-like enzyme
MQTALYPATVADVEKIAAMRRQLYEKYPATIDEPRDRHTLLQLIEQPALGAAWLIIADGKTVGYALVTYCYSIEFGGRFALLDELWLAPETRRHGIGADAIKLIEEILQPQKITALRLEVEQTNSGAQRFYGRNNFQLHDRRLMTRWLNG